MLPFNETCFICLSEISNTIFYKCSQRCKIYLHTECYKSLLKNFSGCPYCKGKSFTFNACSNNLCKTFNMCIHKIIQNITLTSPAIYNPKNSFASYLIKNSPENFYIISPTNYKQIFINEYLKNLFYSPHEEIKTGTDIQYNITNIDNTFYNLTDNTNIPLNTITYKLIINFVLKNLPLYFYNPEEPFTPFTPYTPIPIDNIEKKYCYYINNDFIFCETCPVSFETLFTPLDQILLNLNSLFCLNQEIITIYTNFPFSEAITRIKTLFIPNITLYLSFLNIITYIKADIVTDNEKIKSYFSQLTPTNYKTLPLPSSTLTLLNNLSIYTLLHTYINNNTNILSSNFKGELFTLDQTKEIYQHALTSSCNNITIENFISNKYYYSYLQPKNILSQLHNKNANIKLIIMTNQEINNIKTKIIHSKLSFTNSLINTCLNLIFNLIDLPSNIKIISDETFSEIKTLLSTSTPEYNINDNIKNPHSEITNLHFELLNKKSIESQDIEFYKYKASVIYKIKNFKVNHKNLTYRMQLILLKSKTEIGYYFQNITVTNSDFIVCYLPNDLFLLHKPLLFHSQVFVPLFKSSVVSDKDYFQL